MNQPVIGSLTHRAPVPPSVWISTILVCCSAGMAAVLWGIVWAFVPLIAAIATICVLNPATGLNVLICSLFFPYPMFAWSNAVPADLVVFLVVIGVWLEQLRQGRIGLMRTAIDIPVAVWLAVMALSLIEAQFFQRGVINWLRHVQLILLMYATAILVDERQLRRTITLLLVLTCMTSLWNVGQLLATGGERRIFGIARVYLGDLLTLPIVYCVVSFLFAARSQARAGWLGLFALYTLAILASQTRGAMLQTVLSLLIIFVLGWAYAKRNKMHELRTNILRFAVGLVAIGALLAPILAPYLATTYERVFSPAGSSLSSINFREFLWQIAARLFFSHPLLGIGIGQGKEWLSYVPQGHLESYSRFTVGMGFHNSTLTYLAETGMIGMLAYLWFLAKTALLGWRLLALPADTTSAKYFVCVWAVVLTIVFRSFFLSNLFYSISGMTTALSFGFLIRYSVEQRLWLRR